MVSRSEGKMESVNERASKREKEKGNERVFEKRALSVGLVLASIVATKNFVQ